MTVISLDRQTFTETCPGCGASFSGVRGSIFEDGIPRGLYLVALHGHEAAAVAHLAIARLTPESNQPQAVALRVSATDEQFRFTFTDWRLSPWQNHDYLGSRLDRDAALVDVNRRSYLHIAEHVVSDLDEVKNFFA